MSRNREQALKVLVTDKTDAMHVKNGNTPSIRILNVIT